MKLRLIVQDDPVERVTLGLRTSVIEKLRDYKAFYESALGGKVQQNYLVEEMLKSCMAEDKAFQKFLKTRPEPKTGEKRDPGTDFDADDDGKPAAGNTPPTTATV